MTGYTGVDFVNEILLNETFFSPKWIWREDTGSRRKAAIKIGNT
jgi:hypothetical protein